MLTKQAREKIAERAKICDCLHFSGLYECLLGHSVPADTSNKEDYKVFLARLIDLCDTSDMVELPLDKNGKVIHIGDTVYDENMNKCSVKSIEYGKDNNVCIHCFTFSTLGTLSYYPHQLTHQFISETEQLAKALKHAVDTFNEYLREVASYIGSLDDNND